MEIPYIIQFKIHCILRKGCKSNEGLECVMKIPQGHFTAILYDVILVLF